MVGCGRGLFGFVFSAGGPRGVLPRSCRVLVLLNPRGGKGKALQLFRSHVQPLLAEAEISFTLMLTGEYLSRGFWEHPLSGPPVLMAAGLPAERRNHARELVRSEELGRWDALVVMSGDGLMHEVRTAPRGLACGLAWDLVLCDPG